MAIAKWDDVPAPFRTAGLNDREWTVAYEYPETVAWYSKGDSPDGEFMAFATPGWDGENSTVIELRDETLGAVIATGTIPLSETAEEYFRDVALWLDGVLSCYDYYIRERRI